MNYLPNLLSFSRMALTPIFLYFLFSEGPYFKIWALLVFIVASLTDTYDGYFARKLQVVTRLGKFIDPLADKILVWSSFIGFVLMGVVELWMVLLIVLRDISVTGLRMFYLSRKGKSMQTSYLAKFKTTFQLITIIVILLYLITQTWPILRGIGEDLRFIQQYHILGIANLIDILMLLTTFLTVLSGIHYFMVNLSPRRAAE